MKILVLGGYGYFGNNLLEMLRQQPGYDLWSGGRHCRDNRTVTVDWHRPDETLAAFLEFDVVVNAAPWPPGEQLRQYLSEIISNGKTWIETTADVAQTKKLLAWKPALPHGPGAVIIGVGVFPGLSNLLAGSFSSGTGRLDLAIRYDLFSGAGPGMCRLMAETLTQPSEWLEDGIRKDGPAVGPTAIFSWSGGAHAAMRVSLADGEYLFRREGIRDAATYLSVRPDLLNKLGGIANSLPRSRFTVRFLTTYFMFLRGTVFGKRRTPIEFCVSDGKTVKRLFVSDAFTGGSLCLAACLYQLKNANVTGFRSIEDILTLEDLLSFHKNNTPVITLAVWP